jgi:DNA-directed RNA polymerase specialized sigma subunit
MTDDLEFKWEKEVSRAVKKISSAHVVDKQDLAQECRLALLQASNDIDTSEQAYKLAVAVARNFVHILDDATESLSDGVVAREAEMRTTDNVADVMFDVAAVRQVVSDLADRDERFVVAALFGIGRTQMSERELAKYMMKSPSWVHQKKEAALESLRRKLRK